MNIATPEGTSQGKPARINKVSIRLLESLGMKYGADFVNLSEINFRSAFDSMDNPPALFSGDILLDWPGDYTTNPWLCFVNDQPLPSTIVAIMPEMRSYST